MNYCNTHLRKFSLLFSALILLGEVSAQVVNDRYEAENAVLSSSRMVVATNHVGFSGTGFVDFPNPPGTDFLEWTITVPGAAVYDLSVIYASQVSTDRPLRMLVNGTQVGGQLPFASTGAWTNYLPHAPVRVSLAAGTHRVRILPDTAVQGPNVDYLQVTGNPVSLPSAQNDVITVPVRGTIAFDPRVNDSAGAGYQSLSIFSQPSQGIAVADSASGTIMYTHTGSSPTADSFRYTFQDTTGATSTATVSVTVTNNARLPNTTLTFPDEAPAGGSLQLVNALPGLTFSGAVAITPVPGRPQSLIIASINGAVWMVPDTTAATPVRREILNLASLSNFTRGRSIYSIVCHPDFATNGRFIVNYQGDGTRLPSVANISNLDILGPGRDFDSNIECDLRVSEFTLSTANLNTLLNSSNTAAVNSARNAVRSTERPIINLAAQGLYHSINDCHFGPEGYLYVSFGDEGGQGEPGLNAQSITRDQYSSIIRIDVDRRNGNLEPNPHYSIPINPATGRANFSIPVDNPYVGPAPFYNGAAIASADIPKVRTEIWVTGLRNPFKFHIDPDTHEIWVGDVGFDSFEEVSVLQKGDNAGWSYFEGNERRTDIAHAIPPADHTPPIHAYDHSSGDRSVTGGILYKGTAYTSLNGKYIFGDFGSGRIWTIERGSGGAPAVVTELPVGGLSGHVDYEVDAQTGQVLILQHSGGGRVMRLIEQSGGSTFPQLLSQTGIFSDLATLTPNAGIVDYEPNLTFWSDHAIKSRFFAIKNTVDTVGFSRDGNWSFPAGMVFIKHFDIDLDRDNPGSRVRRLETRVIVINDGGSYGVSYRWNEAGTDATLAPIGGVDFDLQITENSSVHTQRWRIPSRGECLTCHTPDAGHALSFNTPQLNRAGELGPESGNFMSLLESSGYLTGLNEDPATLPRYARPEDTSVDIESRVRAYLAVNCAYCHQPGGSGPPSWNGLAQLPLNETGILYGDLISEAFHRPEDFTALPGNPDRSAILSRMKARDAIGDGDFQGYSQMPPLGSNVVDPAGVALVEEWIRDHANVAPALPAGTPTFVTIPDDTGLEASLASVAGTDPDVRAGVADQDRLRYEIVSGNGEGLFKIDPATGQVRVNGLLDFRRQTSHVLTITATDGFAANPGVVTHTLAVNLADAGEKDADGNGLPDFWERGYSLVGATAATDSDGDGTRDYFEFLTGSDPVDSGSAEEIPEIVAPVSPPEMVLEWRARNGLRLGSDYFVETSSDLERWNTLREGDGYELVSVSEDGPGFARYRIRTMGEAEQFFIRLSDRPAEVSLFNGTNLDGWEIKQGSLSLFSVVPASGGEPAQILGTADNSLAMLGTVAEYSDFELNYEFRVDDGLNSGMQIRSFLNGNFVQGYQIEIDPSGRAWSGGIFEQRGRGWVNDLSGEANRPAREAFIPNGWNRIRAVVSGNRVQTWINGVPAADYTETEAGIPTSGFLAIQVHQGTDLAGKMVRFRNLFITEL